MTYVFLMLWSVDHDGESPAAILYLEWGSAGGCSRFAATDLFTYQFFKP
jgi:hypothetical protein